jgi:hypothetical protein
LAEVATSLAMAGAAVANAAAQVCLRQSTLVVLAVAAAAAPAMMA